MPPSLHRNAGATRPHTAALVLVPTLSDLTLATYRLASLPSPRISCAPCSASLLAKQGRRIPQSRRSLPFLLPPSTVLPHPTLLPSLTAHPAPLPYPPHAPPDPYASPPPHLTSPHRPPPQGCCLQARRIEDGAEHQPRPSCSPTPLLSSHTPHSQDPLTLLHPPPPFPPLPSGCRSQARRHEDGAQHQPRLRRPVPTPAPRGPPRHIHRLHGEGRALRPPAACPRLTPPPASALHAAGRPRTTRATRSHYSRGAGSCNTRAGFSCYRRGAAPGRPKCSASCVQQPERYNFVGLAWTCPGMRGTHSGSSYPRNRRVTCSAI